MNLSQYTVSLKTKLSILVAIAVMLVVIALGFYFDNSLKKNSLKDAHTRILHGYQRLQLNLNNIENSLKEGIAFIQSDEQMPASVELINNYQDKNNYNTYLIDEEKKSIARELLNRVKFSFNDDIALYDKNEELIAFVIKDKKGYQLNYISYADSQVKLFKRYEHEAEFTVSATVQLNPNILLNHIAIYKPDTVNEMSLITYHRLVNNVAIKSHQNIVDKDSKQLIGHIEMSRVLDENYFADLSQTINLGIKHSFEPSLEVNATMLDENLDSHHLNITENIENYFVILKQDSLDGAIYYLANLSKTNFNLLLNKSRRQFLVILALVTISILLLMRYIINFYLDRPLSVLMKQIDKIEHQDYTESKPILTGDELEAASLNINRLAETIQQRESELKTSEAHLYTLIQTLPDLVWLKDPDGVYLSCNKKFEHFFGAKEADIIGKTDYDFVSQELADLFKENDKVAMAAGEPTVNEEEVTFASDGHTELLETIITPMRAPDGSLIGVLGVGRDITERKQIEEDLKTSYLRQEKIASRLPGMAYQFELRADGSMHFPYISDAINDVYHLSAEEVQQDVNKIFEVTHPDDLEKLNSTIAESARTLTPWKIEYRVRDKDGSVRWLYCNSVPEKTAEGGVLWHGFITDITRNKEIDETLRRTQKMDALGKLTGGIAHDYNNMLGVVLGYADLLKEMLGDQPELQDYVEQIVYAGDRGAKLTKKLLSFSRQNISDSEVLDINTVLQDDQLMLEKTLTARIQFELKLEKNLWPVRLDESELEDAILNLSINAMHAIENNGRLTIETSNEIINATDAEQLELEPGEYVRMSISDTGSGLDDATKEKIFDPFYTTKGEQGTGLGLAQVYGFIKRSAGAIKVDSALDVGTQFTLYFPRCQDKDKNINEVVSEEATGLKGKETILVVDDEPSLLNLACELLSKQGYQVFCAENAIPALKILETESIDLLVSDIIMPDMDGYKLASIVQEKYPNIKVLLASGFAGEKNSQADSLLAENILQKPYSAQALLRKIQDLLQ